jgi:hypothetical protein
MKISAHKDRSVALLRRAGWEPRFELEAVNSARSRSVSDPAVTAPFVSLPGPMSVPMCRSPLAASNRPMFCARDHFGVRPFYYHWLPGRRFAFASEIRPLLALPDTQQRLNESRVADFLLDFEDDRVPAPSGPRCDIGRSI